MQNTDLRGVDRIFKIKIEEYFAEEKKFSVTSEDIETIHKMRVKTRIIRSLLSFIKPLVSKEFYRKEQNSIRSIGDISSLARDLDVIIKKHETMTRSASMGHEKLIKILKMKKIEEYEKISGLIKSGRSREIFEEFISSMNEEKFWIEQCACYDFKRFAEERISTWIVDILRYEENLDLSNFIRLHKLRIKTKKTRYALEHFGMLGNNSTELLNLIKGLQSSLGEYHDLHRENEILMSILDWSVDMGLNQDIKSFDKHLNSTRGELRRRIAEDCNRVVFEASRGV